MKMPAEAFYAHIYIVCFKRKDILTLAKKMKAGIGKKLLQ
jgi:hypothetical protein